MLEVKLCDTGTILNVGNNCVRAWWTALIPASVVAFNLARLLYKRLPYRPLSSTFSNFLPLDEAVSLLNDSKPGEQNAVSGDEWDLGHEHSKPRWKVGMLAVPAGLETAYWAFLTCNFILEMIKWSKNTDGQAPVASYEIVTAALLTMAWTYAFVRPLFLRNPLTVPYDLFTLYLSILGVTGLNVGAMVYKEYIYKHGNPAPPTSHGTMVAFLLHISFLLGLLAITLSLPTGIPSRSVDQEQIGKTITPEDYTTLAEWITFWWVYPIVKRGTGRTMNEEDVWSLPPGLASKPLFSKFSALLYPSAKAKRRLGLIRALWRANSMDITLDFVLTLVSVICNYLGPFFLKKILDAVSQPNAGTGEPPSSWVSLFLNPREVRAQAYVYAFLAFFASILKGQADVQHLWYGRRAATRIRSELMAAIYEKSLKRKDFSGSTDKGKRSEESAPGAANGKSSGNQVKAAGKENKKKPESNTAGADIGKIVNLMSTDANRISGMVSGLYFIYGAPLELAIGSFFLYQLLGLSGFAGFVILLLGAPINTYLVRRSRDINKAAAEARDKRMKVVNELVSEAKFIKFGAAEEKWIEKCLNARGKELRMLIKSQINSVFFSLTWAVGPVLVSIISFTTFVYTGHKLTVALAFTSIQIFSMIKMPMNVIPTFLAILVNTKVALDRIAQFLDEEEVPAFVSDLKSNDIHDGTTTDLASDQDQRLGIKHGWFRWNQAVEPPEKKPQPTKTWMFWKRSPKKLPTVAEPPTRGGDILESNSGINTPAEIHRFELRDIDIIFPTGRLTLVTGPTASGKTALLMALLGEMTPVYTEGSVTPFVYLPKNTTQLEESTGLRNCISYCSQSPWLEHLSIRDNILFGSPMDQDRYNQVLECCALDPDLNILEDGDQTEIGARGVSLSGGQKARVALARAVYARTKHVLLDDPLSAVDSHTARHLVDKLLRGPLMANRTVILVTHHVELVLPYSQYFVRMLDGRIDTQGTPGELQSRGILDVLVHESQAEEQPTVASAEELAAIVEGDEETQNDIKANDKPKKPRKLVEDEARATGRVKFHVYKSYLKASGYFTWVIMLGILGLGQLGGVVEKLWMQIWGEAGSAEEFIPSTLHSTHLLNTDLMQPGSHQVIHYAHVTNNSSTFPHASSGFTAAFHPLPVERLPSADEHPLFYVGVFACIGLGVVFISILGQITLAFGSYRGSKILFKSLLESVTFATMRWYDVTPAGRILNRFSRDIETVDTSLTYSLRSTLVWIALFFASILTITVIFPGFLIPGILVGFCYYKLSLGYMDAGRDLRRMESNSRSPIFASFGETLEGIVTVRAFAASKRFLDNLHLKVDETTKYWYSFWMLNRWLLLNFDALGALSVLTTTLLVLGGFIPDWLAGLTITSAMNFTTSVYWTCRMITSLELDLNSIERVIEYLSLPQEPPGIIESNRPPAYWPSTTSNGGPMITVKNLVIKYAPTLPAVLHGVSFEVKPGEKIGLLGRTGSGKSTLAMALLRFVDPTEGSIWIDGINIQEIGLRDLRSRLTFIPQDSVLFMGTIRENLDPFSDHSDEECLDALYRVQLISETAHASRRSTRPPSVAEAPTGLEEGAEQSGSATPQDDKMAAITLDTEVSARGANFSAGQRQLISMARALLRQSNIVILDEATSSIDFKTDAKIQAAVREEFKDACLLTVAHRIRTVIDYDRLLILDKGNVVEFDTPWALIQKKGGVFRDMQEVWDVW